MGASRQHLDREEMLRLRAIQPASTPLPKTYARMHKGRFVGRFPIDFPYRYANWGGPNRRTRRHPMKGVV